jgi:rfaE bifunctional protein nucleotidyltransferase chain/domain
VTKPAATPISAPAAETSNKIVSQDDLALQIAALRQQGKTVIHAHGTFDLLHLGHVKHLEAARKKADILIVTLTADKYINKGPGRPVFNEQLRAEMLAALEVVSWVSINHTPDAVPAILKLKANFYAKGQDYINPQGDITGKIVDERNAIESVGGSIMFTEEITFSSTELVNRHMNVFEPHVREHIDRLRNANGLEYICAQIERMQDLRVLVVGDAIIDEYHYIIPMAKAAKENMIACRYQDEERFAGGVFATANHLASFCKQVDIVTCLGARDSKEDFIRSHLKPNVNLKTVFRAEGPTTTKRRFVDPSYMRKLFEVYFMNDEPLLRDVEDELNVLLDKTLGDYDVVIANDFGHGMIGRSTVKILTEKAKFLAVNTQSNSANMGYNLINKYPRADFVCIDAPEARLAVTDKISPIEEIITTRLPEHIQCERFIITHGRHGCVTYSAGDVVHTIPALTKTVVDTVGAGDAFLAITSPLVALGTPLNQVGFVGNVVGALKVGIVGHQKSVEKVNVLKAIQGMLK